MIRKYYPVERFANLRELVDYAAGRYGGQTGFREFGPERVIVDHSFSQLKADTEALGARLLADGLAGCHFAILGESIYHYVLAYLAVVNWVGVVVPMDRELTRADLVRLLKKSDVDVIFYSRTFAEDLPCMLDECPRIRMAILLDPQHDGRAHVSADRREPDAEPCLIGPDAGSDGKRRTDIVRLTESGRDVLHATPIAEWAPPLDPERLCTILFTSGTTGANKGVMLNHRNLATTIYTSLSLFKMPSTSFSVLPINHSYEFDIHVLGSICSGAALCFNDSIKHVGENLAVFKPEMSLMVPMIVEGLHRNIWHEAKKAGLTDHLKYGIWFSNLIRKIGIDKRRYFFKPIHDKLGGRLELIVCGGAPLSPALVKGFDDLGIEVYNGYGITECAPLISSNSRLSSVRGSVGEIVPGIEVRIGDKKPDGTGEIQARGPNVMLGYYKDEAATRESFTDDGWFRTGDIGYLDRKGILFITGRAKNLIILANGKNVHPEELEECLADQIPYLREVVVYAPKDGQGNDTIITAEAFLDAAFTQEHGMEKAKAIFESDVRRVNRYLATYKRIEQILVRDQEFEKTTTRKIKRHALTREAAGNA